MKRDTVLLDDFLVVGRKSKEAAGHQTAGSGHHHHGLLPFPRTFLAGEDGLSVSQLVLAGFLAWAEQDWSPLVILWLCFLSCPVHVGMGQNPIPLVNIKIAGIYGCSSP